MARKPYDRKMVSGKFDGNDIGKCRVYVWPAATHQTKSGDLLQHPSGMQAVTSAVFAGRRELDGAVTVP